MWTADWRPEGIAMEMSLESLEPQVSLVSLKTGSLTAIRIVVNGTKVSGHLFVQVVTTRAERVTSVWRKHG